MSQAAVALSLVFAFLVYLPPAAVAASCTPSGGYNGYGWTKAKQIETNSGMCIESEYAAKLKFQTDGNLVLYSSKGKAVWSSGTSGRGSLLKLALNALVTVNGCTGTGGQGCSNPPAAIWSSKDTTNDSGQHFDKFMIQVGDSVGTPCWVIAAHVKGGDSKDWSPGTIRGGTKGPCVSTIAADGGTGGGLPGGF